MVEISRERDQVVLVTTFVVTPENCDPLLAILADATESVIRRYDGFVSSSFHRGIDGTRVVMYSQWRDMAAFEAMLSDPPARAPMARCAPLVTSFDPQLYHVASVHE